MKKKLTPDQIGGLIVILFGIATLVESRRLLNFRVSVLTGDHILTITCGVALIVLGGILVCNTKRKSFHAVFPEKRILLKMGLIFAVLLLYVLLIRWIGYTAATLLASIALLRIFSKYSILKCALIGILFTAVLYLLFILALEMPFPRGDLFKNL